MKKIKLSLIICFILYLCGFCIFIFNLKYKPNDIETKTDAIIILTGEPNRIYDGIDEFTKGLSDKLFISGIYSSAPIKNVIIKNLNLIKQKRNISIPKIIKNIETGKAENTLGNAIESKTWIENNKIKSARVLTSYYHIPRTKVLYKKYLPNIKIIYHPVSSEVGSHSFENIYILKLSFKEYNKFIITYLWSLLHISTETTLKIIKFFK